MRQIASKQLILSILILAISIGLALLLIYSREKLETVKPNPPAALVETVTVNPKTEQAVIEAYGTVQPDRKVTLNSEVSGRVMEVSPNLIPGGFLKKGEVVLKIDSREFKYLLEQEKAAQIRAEFELKVEEGRQVIAKREWELLDPKLKEMELAKQLALRKPHLKEKQATLEAAKNRVAKAKLDLERTTLICPFDAIVTSEDGQVGQLVTPQTTVATLVATDQFRIQVSIPFHRLSELGNSSPKIVIHQTLNQIEWKGYLIKLLGDIDPNTRMARLLIGVKNPLQANSTPLLLGSYVRVDLYGKPIADVYRLPRRAVREGDQVWIMDADDTLEMRPVHINFKHKQDVIVDQGLNPGDRVIISPLPLAIPGMALKQEETVTGE